MEYSLVVLTALNSIWTIRTIKSLDVEAYERGEVEEVTVIGTTLEFFMVFTLQPAVATAAWLRDNVLNRGA